VLLGLSWRREEVGWLLLQGTQRQVRSGTRDGVRESEERYDAKKEESAMRGEKKPRTFVLMKTKKTRRRRRILTERA